MAVCAISFVRVDVLPLMLLHVQSTRASRRNIFAVFLWIVDNAAVRVNFLLGNKYSA